MSKLPLVAIVGRPNVGKSTLFNKFCGYRKALTHDRPGLTRDRIYGEAEYDGRRFRVVDTGGLLGTAEHRIFEKGINAQAFSAIREAQLVLLVTDAREGLTPADEELAARMRQEKLPLLLVVNKVEGPRQEHQAAEFHRLGLDVLQISAEHRLGLDELYQAIFSFIDVRATADKQKRQSVQLAVVGRPNVGKSTLVNRIIGEDRILVSPVPGTTRDAVDVTFAFRGQRITLVDTAGIRKKAQVRGAEEHLSVSIAIRQIERSNVVIVLVDAVAGVGAQDAAIAGHVERSGKGVLIAVNKWDLVEDSSSRSARDLVQRTRDRLRFLEYAPVLLISALEGKRVVRLLDEALAVDRRMAQRIPTGRLNRMIEKAVADKPPPSYKRRPVKIFYGAQVAARPPVFNLVVNAGGRLHFSYERYLLNRIREQFDFEGVPLRLRLSEKKGPSAAGGRRR